MANYEKKEKYEGIWNGKAVSFNREYCGKRLTNEECEALLRGETIEINGLISKKTHNKYGVKAKLDNLEYNGHKYVGINRVGFAPKGIPEKYCEHTFTDDERNLLEVGEKVYIENFVSKKGSTFSCNVTYDRETDKLIFHFDD